MTQNFKPCNRPAKPLRIGKTTANWQYIDSYINPHIISYINPHIISYINPYIFIILIPVLILILMYIYTAIMTGNRLKIITISFTPITLRGQLHMYIYIIIYAITYKSPDVNSAQLFFFKSQIRTSNPAIDR